MKNTKTLLLLAIASFSMNSFAMTGRHAQKVALNFGGIIAANVVVNIAYADGQKKPENAPDYIDSVKYPEFSKFVAKHRCSPEIEKLVRENESKKTHVQDDIYKYNKIPFYNKGENFSRIVYAEFIKQKIKENHLDGISIPDKCLCHMYGTAWNVIAKKAKPQENPSKLSILEIKKMITLIEETGYSDAHHENLFRDDQNNLIIIDTEIHTNSYILALAQLYWHAIVDNMEPEAQQWLEKQIEQEEAVEKSIFTQLYRTFFSSAYYKKPDINLDQVFKEYWHYQNSTDEETES